MDKYLVKKRAARGRKIVHSKTRHGDSNDNLGDVLLDLMHYAASEGVSFSFELEWAANHFAEERRE